MNELRLTEETPDPRAFAALFETTGWNESYRATVDELAAALECSWKVLSAYADGRLVGIGSAIMDRLLAACREAGIRDIQLFAAAGKAPFYERHGFRRRPEEAPGMRLARRNDDAG